MPLLGNVLFPLADTRRTTLSILGWWEGRRLTFNIAVGVAGLLTLAAIRVVSWMPHGFPIGFVWRPVLAYAMLANVCYTLGWTLEAFAQRVWGAKCPRFGPALFRQGLAFSVGLTLLPILIVTGGWIALALLSLIR